MTETDVFAEAGYHARERTRAAITHLVRDTAGDDAFREVPIWPGARTTEHRPEPRHGLQAALRLRNEVTGQARRFVEELRAAGVGWLDIAAELSRGSDAEDVSAVFEEFAVPGLMPFDPSRLSWRCDTCGERVMDYGPYNPHPDDVEEGHAEDCSRHAGEVQAFERARTGGDGLDEPGLLERTGGMEADCEGCGEPISAATGYGALCGSCEQDNG